MTQLPQEARACFLHFGGERVGLPDGPFLTVLARYLGGSVLWGGSYRHVHQFNDGTPYIKIGGTPSATIQFINEATQ